MDFFIEPFEEVFRQGGTRGKKRFQRTKIMFTGGIVSGFFNRSQKFRAGAEMGDLLIIDQFPHPVHSWEAWRSVVEDKACSTGESTDQPVPHHPAAGSEVK